MILNVNITSLIRFTESEHINDTKLHIKFCFHILPWPNTSPLLSMVETNSASKFKTNFESNEVLTGMAGRMSSIVMTRRNISNLCFYWRIFDSLADASKNSSSHCWANFEISKTIFKLFQLSIFIVRLAQVVHITESIHKSHIALLCSNWFISLTNEVWMVFNLVSVSNDDWFCQNRIAIAYIIMLTLYVFKN